MNRQRGWVTDGHKDHRYNRRAQAADVLNSPAVRRQLSLYLELLQKQVNNGTLTQKQAQQIFNTTVKQLSNTIQRRLDLREKQKQQGYLDPNDLSNPNNMQRALQIAGGIANQQMVEQAAAIEMAINIEMDNEMQTDNLQAAELQQADNVSSSEMDTPAPTPESTSNENAQTTELAAATDTVCQLVADISQKSGESEERSLFKGLKNVAEKLHLKTDDMENPLKRAREESESVFKPPTPKPPKLDGHH